MALRSHMRAVAAQDAGALTMKSCGQGMQREVPRRIQRGRASSAATPSAEKLAKLSHSLQKLRASHHERQLEWYPTTAAARADRWSPVNIAPGAEGTSRPLRER